ncbi:MAG: DUF2306 domain-containing protein [Protaetiibacter sp.]
MTVTTPGSRGSAWVPVGLILLTLIPIVSGSLRLTQLGGGPQLLPAAARFTDFPWPVVIHIVAATLYSVVGAFQFLPGLRRGRRSWHRMAGRVLLPAGALVALSGMWMGAFSALPAGDGVALMVLRLGFGGYMLAALALGARAIVQRRFAAHGAWMTRAYAIGVAAGTQAIFLIPVSMLLGPTHEAGRAIAMGLAWLTNLLVAELAIRRRATAASADAVQPPMTVASTSFMSRYMTRDERGTSAKPARE